MNEQIHPTATQHLPIFVTAPGDTDVLFVVTGVFLGFAVLMFGILFLRLHSLPEQMAHKSQKLQFEVVAVLCLISLFTHMHIFWIAGLLLALIDLPDFGTPLNRIARSAEKVAGISPPEGSTEAAAEIKQPDEPVEPATENSSVAWQGGTVPLPARAEITPAKPKERVHA